MFKGAPNIVRWTAYAIIFSLIAVSSAFVGANWYLLKNPTLTVYTAAPSIRSLDGTILETAEPGSVFVWNATFERRDADCYADYLISMRGPVSYQFPLIRSTNIVKTDEVIRTEANVLLRFPDYIPDGAYSVRATVFPICNGHRMNPYALSFDGNPMRVAIAAKPVVTPAEPATITLEVVEAPTEVQP